MVISPLHDAETLRQQRNLTSLQRKTNSETREGVLVNNFIKDKDCPECSLNDTMDTLVISKNTTMPEKLYEKDRAKKSLMPISTLALGVMGVIAGVAGLVCHASKINLTMDSLKRVPATVRNVAINDETFQALYRIVECPNYKTIQAGVGVFALTVMAFMGKTFFDGFKDVWVKKKEADIQKNLQEKLIDIETQSFAGKIQITRSMLSQKAIELGKYLNYVPKQKHHETFKSLMFGSTSPHSLRPTKSDSLSDDNQKTSPRPLRPTKSDSLSDDIQKISPRPLRERDEFLSERSELRNSGEGFRNYNYLLLGLATFAGIIGLGFLSLKLLTRSKGHLEKFIKETKDEAVKIVKNSTDKTKKQDIVNLENLFKTVEASEDDMREILKPLNWSDKEGFIKRLSKEINKSTVDANIYCGGGKTPKPTFYSHVNDYRAFLYNYLLDTENKQFKALFLGTTGLTAIGYGGNSQGMRLKMFRLKN